MLSTDADRRHLIVTVIDGDYWQALVALHNSYLKHSRDGFDFAALVFGEDDLIGRVKARGIRVIANPEFPIKELPKGKHHRDPVRLRGMYGRLLIPTLFPEYRRSVYVDADSIILQSLRPLAEMPMTKPIAATQCNGPMSYNVVGREFPFDFGPMSSLYVTDHALWASYQIDRKWIEAAQDPTLGFPFTVQGVLQTAIGEDWHCLPWQAQAHAGHDTFYKYPKREIYTLHFMGTNPWEPLHQQAKTTYQGPARKLWEQYLCMSS